MSHILLTGGTGFVGSHVAEKLCRQGATVYATVRKTSDTAHLQALGVHLLQAELTDAAAVNTAFEKLQNDGVKLDAVIHCAALTLAPDYATFEKVNVTATETLTRAAAKYQPNLGRFVFISSLAASGPTDYGKEIPLSQIAPVTHYGRSKVAAEKIVRDSGLPYTILRPTAVYGPREKDIFTLFKVIKSGLFPLIGSNKQALTFVYVSDLADLIIEAATTAPRNAAYFVTDGKTYDKAALGKYIKKHLSVRAWQFTLPLGLMKILANVSEKISAKAPLNREKYKELKAESWNCEMRKTFADFEFAPIYDLEKGVGESVAWYRQKGWL